ncbi:galactose mutarotase [Sphingobacterium sp. lm-10]|uniref:aldose epimerase family protein n=1 Tax=Sphingobacterium sp. lm-10 TaxID=2944904 RepID=UPI0020204BE5|nr:aldose epimerase family protein [Sphingobacterium sp. lm-10]MCL7988561.1 galactose mutarotase [Sphingobacterium sp. lm-10]
MTTSPGSIWKACIAPIALAITLSSCNQSANTSKETPVDTVDVGVSTKDFTGLVGQDSVKLYTISNGTITAAITNYGARVVSLIVPDSKGNPVDVVLGYKDLENYTKAGEGFYGAIVGRFGNRIAKGQFKIDGKPYQLELNDGVNTLHGGKTGYYTKVWTVNKVSENSVELHLLSPNGDAGYPGALDVYVTYSITADNGLDIAYRATTDKKTIVNLTNHAYFNLSGEGAETITDHQLMVQADRYTPVDKTLIPTGELATVENTPFDFRTAKAIGEHIDADDAQIKIGGGYDHNFVLNKKDGLQHIATVSSPKTGIQMDILTEEPGLQFYSGNFMDNIQNAKGGKTYGLRSAFCLETQHFPDAPNQASFPSTELAPGETYATQTTYRFNTVK